jgi:hypothetical protein
VLPGVTGLFFVYNEARVILVLCQTMKIGRRKGKHRPGDQDGLQVSGTQHANKIRILGAKDLGFGRSVPRPSECSHGLTTNWYQPQGNFDLNNSHHVATYSFVAISEYSSPRGRGISVP